jgi:Aspartyl/Asparaginyl beta-hydroxylase
MNPPPADPLEQGRRALEAGDRASALAAFNQADDQTQIPYMALARACFEAGDAAGEEAALAARIRAVRGDIGAILAMAEAKRRAHDSRAAASFYKLALATAAQVGSVPPALGQALTRAETYLAQADREFATHLFAQLDAAGVRRSDASPRIAEALAMLSGEQPLFLQQPSMFYFPGLAQRPWWDAREFAWAAEIEAATDAITAELTALLAGADAFTPYVQASPDRPPPNNPLLDKPDWGAAWLLKDGEVAGGMAAACPATLAALALAPQPVIPRRAPLALFSRLKPGTHILPHHGMLNTRLICHLPLIVPEGCGLRVGAKTRAWQRGKLTIFDDSFEHEAWNRGTSDRTVLLFEIWRPDLTADERDQLTRIFAAIDSYDVN